LQLRIAIVEHVAHHAVTGQYQTEGTGGGNAQIVHRFTAQELAHGRAQYRPPISTAGIWRWPGTFELELPVLATGKGHLSQIDGTTIAQLSGPVAELVSTISCGIGHHAR